jgi:hypothetical protein
MKYEINQWTRKSKKYRTRYLDELGKLYKEVQNDKESHANRGPGTNETGQLANESKN